MGADEQILLRFARLGLIWRPGVVLSEPAMVRLGKQPCLSHRRLGMAIYPSLFMKEALLLNAPDALFP